MKKVGLTIIAGAAAITAVAAEATKTKSKPNVVFFLMDDMGYGDLSMMGSVKIETPNIDALAANGKMLTQHYSGAPVSAPSRCVLLTGQHTGHTPIRGNDEYGERGNVWSFVAIAADPNLEGQRPMPANTRTLAHELQDAGYTTACIGKWGLGAPGSASEPNKMGFDFFYGHNCQRVSHTYYPSHLYRNTEREYINDAVELGAKIDQGADPLDPRSYDKFNTGKYAPDLMFDETIKFIERSKDKPFFLWWTTPLPHVSLQAPAEWIEYYHKRFGNEKPFAGNHYTPARYPHATYAAMIGYVDDQIGKIVQKLKDEGVYDNTIIIFTSDNGPSPEGGVDSPWFDSARPFKSEEGWGKRSLHEGGLRVPTVVVWDGHIKPGTSSATICGFQDWLPTFAQIAGVEPRTAATDGVNLLPTLTGKGEQTQHDYLYWEYPDGGGSVAVRSGDWKMIVKRVMKTPTYYLYNIATDPREQTNLASQFPERVEAMKKLAAAAHTEPENKMFKMNLPLK